MLLLLLHAVEVPSYLAVAAGFWPLRAPVAAIRGAISSNPGLVGWLGSIPRFRDDSNPSHVWLAGWVRSNLLFG